MATIARPARMPAESRFFLIFACVMAAVIVAGFSLQLAMGRSTFRSPPLLHVHALVFFGWTALYVLQNALAVTGRRLHRTLGWIGTGWAAAVVLLGLYMTAMMVRRGAAPFFFEPAYFLFMNGLTVLGFGGLFAAGIVLRRRTDWHRRLIFCGMAILTGPAVGRLLPLPLLIPHAGNAVFAGVILFPLAGIVFDLRRRGLVHPAWWWGAGAIAAIQLAIAPLADSLFGEAIYGAIVRGGAGEGVAAHAYPPFPTG